MDSSSEDISKEQKAQNHSNDEFIGMTLDGKYLIEELLGTGGMGAVYKGRHLLMEREVAIKLLHLHLALGSSKDEFFQRFQREARTASKLNHPGAVTIHDFGITEDLPYIIMEFNPGFTLGSLLEQSDGLKLNTILQIMKPICGALDAAHSLGIIHRDLKPDNVMVYKDDNGKRSVQVLDFGIAKLADQPQEQSMTMTGTLVGTPYYMSPEQIRCESLDSRSDIYSLGIMLYQMLSGELPFTAKSSAEVLLMHLSEVPPTPQIKLVKGDKAPNKVIAISKVVIKALEKDPNFRQQNVVELYNELHNAISQSKSPSSNKSIVSSFERIVTRKEKKKSLLTKLVKIAIPVVAIISLSLFGVSNDTQEISQTPQEQLSTLRVDPKVKEAFTKQLIKIDLQWEMLDEKRKENIKDVASREIEIRDLQNEKSIKKGEQLQSVELKIEDRKLRLEAKKLSLKLEETNIFSVSLISKIEESKNSALALLSKGKAKESRETLVQLEEKIEKMLDTQKEIYSLGNHMTGSLFEKRTLFRFAEKRKLNLKNTKEKASKIQALIDSAIHDGLFKEASNEYIKLTGLYKNSLITIKANIKDKRDKAEAKKRAIAQEAARAKKAKIDEAEAIKRAEIAATERRMLEIERDIAAQEQKRKSKSDAIDTGFKVLQAIGSVLD